MSKSRDNNPTSFHLETDDRSEEERARAKHTKKSPGKDKMPMDSNYLEDVVDATPRIKINFHFDKGIRQVKEEPSHKDSEAFTIKTLFEAVSRGDVSKLQGLHQYLHKNMKHLTDSQYKSNGKTVLLKALLNLKDGENDTIAYLLDIAEKMGDLKNFVNAAYTDSFYKGQTALHVAIERRSAKFVQMLVKKGADVHAKACGKFFQPNERMCFYFGELPLSLAACTNQPDIVDFLMENPYQPVDVKQRDSHGNMVLHALVTIADNSPENTEFVIAMYDHILKKSAQLHPKLKLEEIENNQGLTPIKLAAKTGKYGLFKHIVQREFKDCRQLSRKITEWAYGPVCSSLYDLASLDSYEKNSVLKIIVYGSEIPNRLEMLHIEPLNKLLEEKWDRFAQWIFFFNFIFYLAYLVIFTTVSYYRQEGTPPFYYDDEREHKRFLAGHIITSTGAVYFFFRGVVDLIRKRPRFQSLLIDGYTDHLFLLQAVLFLVCAVLYICGQDEYLAFLVLSLALSWVNLLYFSRGSKFMGIYSVMIQKMILGEIRRFLVVYMVFLIGFSAAVVTLLDGKPRQKSRTFFKPLQNSTGDCVKPEYDNIYRTTLELFKFAIGMGDLEFTDQYKYQTVFYVLMILYIVLTYILLLNMLIALMNKSVEDTHKESTSIWKLQRAMTILDMEWFLPRCLKKRLRFGEEKDLGEGQEPDQRWCFSVEEVNWNQWNRNLGIINEDPGNLAMPEPSPPKPKREFSRLGLLPTFSKRWTQRQTQRSDAHELSPLAEVSSAP
ncbi:transient receptor potential cation channel subfamily V member 1 [Triplophysa rosa]|uniref:Transient receptor potential cation channel subfamily V member 1 n=1 Tax=Triplophysa rosa TaxID=992332 RepID=A0A9W8C9U6_TRIRA|nr:transient receptor potential cation channel subfamily V member 1 [Triplophysa rosa]KAI7812786.1 transient receptor potential cation channel subfamily V member 1 [Triplophysa rosa]